MKAESESAKVTRAVHLNSHESSSAIGKESLLRKLKLFRKTKERIGTSLTRVRINLEHANGYSLRARQ
jgi:hypothetical protein